MKERILWWDYTKGIGILFIVLAHVVQYSASFSDLNTYICSFHVPIFFILDGYMCKQRNVTDIRWKRIKKLLVPYLLFSCINSALKLGVLFLTGNITGQIIFNEAKEFFLTGNGTVWFIQCLLLVEVLYTLLNKCHLGSMGVPIAILLCFMGAFLIPTTQNPLLIITVRTMMGLGYFMLGQILSGAFNEENNTKLVFYGVILAIVGGAMYKGVHISLFTGEFSNPIVSIVSSVTSCMGYMLLLKYLEKKTGMRHIKGILSYFGRNSLIVMLIHPILLNCVMYPFGTKLGSMTGGQAITAFWLIYVVICVIEIPFIIIINKHFSWVMGDFRRNGRNK